MDLRPRPAHVPSPLPAQPAALATGQAGYATVMVDRTGRALVLGSAVLVHGGDHAGRVAEVVGWGGRRGVEIIVHGRPPAFLAMPTALVELVDAVLLDPVLPCRRPRGVRVSGGRRRAAAAGR